MRECPVCKALVKPENYAGHMQKVHHKTVEEAERRSHISAKGDERALRRRELRLLEAERKKKMYIAVGSAIAVTIVIVAIALGYFYRTPAEVVKIDNKKVAPDFTLQDASETMISLHNFKGKVVVLHFMQVLSDCHGTYFYKSDDRAEYDPSLSGYVSLAGIGTIYEFEELKSISNKYSSSNVVIISIIVPPGCCGDPLKFSQDFKNNYDLSWHVASDTMQYDTWYKYIDYLPSDSNHVFTRDPTILVIDKEQHIVYDSGYIENAILSSKIDPLL